jgi:hypothetical protein
VRAKNSSPSGKKLGQAYLAMSNPAVVIWPGGDGWTRIPNTSGSYASSLGDVGPGGIGVTDEPFVFTPDEFGHRCLVSWLSTTDHPVDKPPPRIDNCDDPKYLVEHPNYAHHNIDIARHHRGGDLRGSTAATPPASGASIRSMVEWLRVGFVNATTATAS